MSTREVSNVALKTIAIGIAGGAIGYIASAVLATSLGLTATEMQAESSKKNVVYDQQQADEIVDNINTEAARILFFQEPRSGICFAQLQNWSPSMTTVDCDKVPAALLIHAKIQPKQ